MKHYITLFILLLYCLTLTAGQKITLLFAGDAMNHSSQITAAEQPDGKYDYSEYFEYLTNEVKSAGISVVNLETTHAGKPYTGYPAFSYPDEFSAELQRSGFNLFMTANNHCADKGKKGIERTIDVLDSLEINHTGTFKDPEIRHATYPLLVEKNGFRLAFLNYTYDTNEPSVTAPNIVNEINDKVILQDIKKVQSQNPDLIIACMHWGVEYSRSPNEEQRRLAKLMIDNGVKIIIGSHPHVIQPMEGVLNSNDSTYQNIVAYSLGNFMSNQNDRYTDCGAMVKIDLEKNGENRVNITGCAYSLVWRYRYYENGKRHYTLIPAYIFDHNPETVKPALQARMKEAFTDARELLKKHNLHISEYVFNPNKE
jgi:poly-gamma-glutamate synthesis protein (capsule biosynthesis protein)